MRWYHYVAYFFGGMFLANALPHLGNGISGHAFQSPFARPPGEGLSSSTVNVLWGLFNLAVGYLLACRVGDFNLRKTPHVLVLGAGILVQAVMLARVFGPLHGGVRVGGQSVLSPLRGWVHFARLPTAYAVGCILLPLRGSKTRPLVVLHNLTFRVLNRWVIGS
jgi:hypothetical protein